MSDPGGRREDAQPDDHRGIAVCAVLAVMAVAVGVVAVVADEAVLALVAAVIGVAAAGVGALLDVRRAQSDRSLLEARAQARRFRRELQYLQATAADDTQRADLAAELGADIAAGADDWEIDPISGLLRERHLPVLLQQVVAAARRKVLPVSVVFWEVDGLAAATAEARDQAVTALGAVAWSTLRESDALFRIGDLDAVAVLVDTAEPGALTVAERVRDQLRASPVGDSLTVSAGIACYPSHALDAAELVSRAGRALETAWASGFERDHVAIASAEQL